MKVLRIVWMFVLMVTVASCASHKEFHRSHAVDADTLAAQAKIDTHVDSKLTRIDSIFNMLKQHLVSESKSSEQSNETVNETITTSTDSLGRESRTEQRTINRTVNREEQKRQEQWQEQMLSQIHTLQQQYDSLFHAFESRMESHWQQADSTSAKKDVEQTAVTSWWQRLKDKVLFSVVVIILLAALWLTRSWWKNLLKL